MMWITNDAGLTVAKLRSMSTVTPKSDPGQMVKPAPEVLQSGHNFLMQYPRTSLYWRALSQVTILAVGLVAKAFVKGRHHTSVHNTEAYHEAMRQAKLESRGLVTVMNHVSILDDPLVWGGTASISQLAQPDAMRWTLGAKDICFRNKAESLFFSLGQTLSTERFGRGPDQPALDAAVTLLTEGRWVHLYPEGFVHQPYEPYEGTLRYFHWGVSRLVLEPGPKAPIVLPIYGKGLQRVFPEDRKKRMFGYGSKYPIDYAFGEPLDAADIESYRERWMSGTEDTHALRSEVANYIRDGVMNVKMKYFPQDYARDRGHDLDQKFATAAFWKDQTSVKVKGKSMLEKREKI